MKKTITMLLALLLVFSCAGCFGNSVEHERPEEEKTPLSAPVVVYEIGIEIKGNEFNSFLENPSMEKLNTWKKYEHTHVDSPAQMFLSIPLFIKENLVKFVSDKVAVQEYLSQNGVNGTIKNIALFQGPHCPVTIWVEMEDKSVFIEIEHISLNEEEYTYKIYTHEEYKEAFLYRDAKLIANGKEIIPSNSRILKEIDHDDIYVPLFEVLRALDVEIDDRDKNKIKMSANGEICYLEPEQLLYNSKDEDKENGRIGLTSGGLTLLCQEDGVYYVNSFVLSIFTNALNLSVDQDISRETNTITISIKENNNE
ncbi:MAG: hypothetical protein IKB86_01250 [Clostridia bacterium]|nr:hypothetical protein [Clostridia bacterium]